jgi:hypothetical protein
VKPYSGSATNPLLQARRIAVALHRDVRQCPVDLSTVGRRQFNVGRSDVSLAIAPGRFIRI